MDATHFHLALNHLPVIGLVLAVLIYVVGRLRRSQDIERLALALFVMVALAVLPVRLSGERAEEGAERLPGVTESVIERHEDAAGLASAAAITIGLVALVGLLGWRRRQAPALFAGGLVALALVASGLMAWTANLGGQVRHTEIRAGAASVAGGADVAHENDPSEERHDEDD